MLAGIVTVITMAALPQPAQDTAARKDTAPPSPTATPTIEQIRYLEGLKTATRGVAQIRDGLNRVVRTQQAGDSLTRRRAARRLGGLCGSARSFILSGRPKMQPTAYADSMRILAKQLVTRLDSLSSALPTCEKTAGHDPATVATDQTKRLSAYDDALLAFRNGQALNRSDSSK